jgi:hypothetical protein
MRSAQQGRSDVDQREATGQGEKQIQRFRWWVILLGVVLIPINSLWIARSEALDYSGFPTCASLFYNVIFSLMVLMLINVFVRRVRPDAALNRPELLVLYGMIATGSSLVGHDYMQMLVPTIPHAGFFATPENRWGELIIPHLPSWLTIDSTDDAIRNYQYGHSTLYTWAHIRIWIGPILAWSVFLLSVVAAMLSINIILRRQWVEHERLTYPIVQIPILITEGGGDNSLFRNKLLWLGFGIAAGINILNGFAFFYPSLPSINVKLHDLTPYFVTSPWNAMGWTPISFYPFVIGLSFFMPTNIAFSSWFFFLVRKGQQVTAASLGYQGTDVWTPFLKEQAYGAWIALFLVVLWLSRSYLKEVFRAAWTNTGRTEDGGVSYRSVLLALGIALLVMMVFLSAAGMSPVVAVLFVTLYIMFCGAVTRVRAELGPPSHEMGWMSTANMMVLAVGSSLLGPKNLAIFSLLYFQDRMYRGLLMPQQAEALKAASEGGLKIRTMVIALAIAGVVGVFSAFWAMLHISYSGSTVGSAPGAGFSAASYNRLASWLSSPVSADTMGVLAISIGAFVTIVLARLNSIFYGFPFHPAGYALGTAFGLDYIWFPIMISWTIKVLILRYWGLKGYRTMIPFFVGLVLGEFLIGGMWSFVRGVLGVQTYSFFIF